MRIFYISILSLCLIASIFAEWQPSEIPENVQCDSDSDCFLFPSGPLSGGTALIYLSCTGGKPWDIDSIRPVHDSLAWTIATCGKSRNHRSGNLNEKDIIKLAQKLIESGRVDAGDIFLYGFSGQGAQALGTTLKYPGIFAGAIVDCAHLGGISTFDPNASINQIFYIVTRQEDWNRQQNEQIHSLFGEYNITDTLIIYPGEHQISEVGEVFRACKWIEKTANHR